MDSQANPNGKYSGTLELAYTIILAVDCNGCTIVKIEKVDLPNGKNERLYSNQGHKFTIAIMEQAYKLAQEVICLTG